MYNCVVVSDTNKQYCINPQARYSPFPPIISGSYTSLIISPNTHNTADIYNTDLDITPEINEVIKSDLKLTATGKEEFNQICFGFKDARDAVEKYEIFANGITIYTQNFAIEELFLTNCCSNEISKRADVCSKARHKDVWDNRFGRRCGVVFNWEKDKFQMGTKKIHLKIDIRRFIPLSSEVVYTW